jgi:glycosyltransferase involved in cell wall biosynthesis
MITGMVSIIIPTFNRWENLLKAIESVKNQTYKNIEIIVINDCSTEEKYKNKIEGIIRIDLPINMRKKHNYGSAQGMTKNEGIKIARGEWIAFLDDDDYWYPTKLEKQIEMMKNHKVLFCSTNMDKGYGIYKDDIIKERYHKIKLPEVFDLNLILKCNYINSSSVIVHRNILGLTNGFKLIQYEDYELWKEILFYTKCLYLDESLVYYDMGHGNGNLYNKW